jgi:hypothetical protein
MRRAVALFAILAMLAVVVVPSPAAAGSFHHHGFHGCCWWPGAVIGGLVLGAVALATLPFYALAAPVAYERPVVVAQPPVVVSQPAPAYAPPPAQPAVQREVVYPQGRYVLYGDGVRQPWQWVWIPAPPPGAPPGPPPSAR